MLTAIGLVNSEWQILTPYRIETPEPIVIKFGTRDYVVTVRYRKSRYCHVMYKLLYPSIRVRTAPPVSVRVRARVSFSFSLTVLHVSRQLLR